MKQIVQGMSTVLSCPLTIKLRRGYYDGGDVAHDILPHVLGSGRCHAARSLSAAAAQPPPPLLI